MQLANERVDTHLIRTVAPVGDQSPIQSRGRMIAPVGGDGVKMGMLAD